MNADTLFCPKCGEVNSRESSHCHRCQASLPRVAPPQRPHDTADYSPPVLSEPKPPANANENTIKFLTIVFFILGLITPLWPVSLPLFWFLAFMSYKKDWTVFDGF